jgi:predicted secreted protein
MFGKVVVVALAAVFVAQPAFAGDQHYRVVATDPKNNARIEVPLGDRLVLRLDACESCGYSWKVVQKPNAAVVAFSRELRSQRDAGCSAPCAGGNAHERFLFQSHGQGETTVKLGYFGPGKHKPSRTKTLGLAVTG